MSLVPNDATEYHSICSRVMLACDAWELGYITTGELAVYLENIRVESGENVTSTISELECEILAATMKETA